MQNSLEDAEKTAPRYPLNSVGKALQLLLMFRNSEQLRLSDASRELEVANSTAHRLLAMLAYHDLVQQVGSSRVYVAGPALIEVGLAVVRDVDVETRARSFLEELATRFDETVHLAVLEGNDVRFLDAVESRQAVRVVTRVGTRLPAHATSVGKALLAQLSTQELDNAFGPDADLPHVTSRSISTRQQLDEELAVIRRVGYANSAGESEEGVASVGVPVFNGGGTRTVAGISVAAPERRMTRSRRREIADALLDVAARLSAELPT